MKSFIVNCWDLVMDSRHNPLRHLDMATQHYFMQVLGWMWSMIFSLSFLSIFQFGYVWLAHLLVFGGFAFTATVFKRAEAVTVDARVTGSEKELGHGSQCVWDLNNEA